VHAHRVVLRRNRALGLDAGPDEGPAGAVEVPVGLETLRTLVRAHYFEVEGAPAAAPATAKFGPQTQLSNLKAVVSEAELAALTQAFGALDASQWMSLHEAVSTERFADCGLQLADGQQLRAHGAIVTSPTDGHFVDAALRWPGPSGNVVLLPEGLSPEVARMLLRMRYGSAEVQVEHILEARHFAELLDWTAVRERCEAVLEDLIAGAGELDADSLVTLVSHATQTAGMPPRLQAAALSAAVRQWSRVAEAAARVDGEGGSALPASRCAELSALHRVRGRDGHVCASLEEYLHAAADDLSEWERNLPLDAPLAARKKLHHAWGHWQQLLFEYGHIHSVTDAEQFRKKVSTRREAFRCERGRQRARALGLPESAAYFEATFEWHEVPKGAVCPAGLEYRCDMQTGRNFARIPA